MYDCCRGNTLVGMSAPGLFFIEEDLIPLRIGGNILVYDKNHVPSVTDDEEYTGEGIYTSDTDDSDVDVYGMNPLAALAANKDILKEAIPAVSEIAKSAVSLGPDLIDKVGQVVIKNRELNLLANDLSGKYDVKRRNRAIKMERRLVRMRDRLIQELIRKHRRRTRERLTFEQGFDMFRKLYNAVEPRLSVV